MRVERGGRGGPQFKIRDIRGDMGEPTRLDLTVEDDGDVIVSLKDTKTQERLDIQFCTLQGGGRNPQITRKLRELARLIVDDYERGEISQPD